MCLLFYLKIINKNNKINLFMKEKIKCLYCEDLNYTTSSNCKKCGENLYKAPKEMVPFWIITIILFIYLYVLFNEEYNLQL